MDAVLLILSLPVSIKVTKYLALLMHEVLSRSRSLLARMSKPFAKLARTIFSIRKEMLAMKYFSCAVLVHSSRTS